MLTDVDYTHDSQPQSCSMNRKTFLKLSSAAVFSFSANSLKSLAPTASNNHYQILVDDSLISISELHQLVKVLEAGNLNSIAGSDFDLSTASKESMHRYFINILARNKLSIETLKKPVLSIQDRERVMFVTLHFAEIIYRLLIHLKILSIQQLSMPGKAISTINIHNIINAIDYIRVNWSFRKGAVLEYDETIKLNTLVNKEYSTKRINFFSKPCAKSLYTIRKDARLLEINMQLRALADESILWYSQWLHYKVSHILIQSINKLPVFNERLNGSEVSSGTKSLISKAVIGLTLSELLLKRTAILLSRGGGYHKSELKSIGHCFNFISNYITFGGQEIFTGRFEFNPIFAGPEKIFLPALNIKVENIDLFNIKNYIQKIENSKLSLIKMKTRL